MSKGPKSWSYEREVLKGTVFCMTENRSGTTRGIKWAAISSDTMGAGRQFYHEILTALQGDRERNGGGMTMPAVRFTTTYMSLKGFSYLIKCQEQRKYCID